MLMVSYDQKNPIVPHFDHLYLMSVVVPLITHHLMPVPVLMASCDQKVVVLSHFDCLNLRNVVVLLMMPMACWHHMAKKVKFHLIANFCTK